MAEIMIFGGTSEGRRLAESCIDNGIAAVYSAVSEYGGSLLPESPLLEVQEKALTEAEMKAWMEEIQPDMVVDATHPYAACVSEYIKKNCGLLGIRRLRIVREESASGWDGIVSVRSAEEAAGYLSGRAGNILVTTGSKELETFTKVPGYEERLFVRVLPSVEVLKKCSSLSIRGKHVIAMQGPFSREMNAAMMRQLNIRFLVTKEAGAAGGFAEKISAAEELGIQAVVIGRPVKEEA
ncbi:precorrin-6A reductase [Clostridium sp. AM58-1XD]|uniref:precorrin-6A reductase n=1 Tax=Clostridium sp. AM58-1XD TaxID=2292307 RepID=UPI000E4C3E3F|nr:precorrin-6A reductase [Clostridium sp. AM58-1XD]RGZ00588.1 precorrin-6A reductase [Clostridium sp. AM58-1XD]